MKILFLSPQPFFQERGTPIAVDLILKVLSSRGDQIDLLTYNEGTNRPHKNVTHFRTPKIPFIKNIRPGFSLKKLILSFFLFLQAIKLSLKNKYELIHAVEEAGFMALALNFLFKTPYIYDMDSSMAQQLIEKMPDLKILKTPFEKAESLIIKHSCGIIAVCDALAEIAKKHTSAPITLLHDISLLSQQVPGTNIAKLKEALHIDGLMLMYIGNLEGYQGIDLVLSSLVELQKEYNKLDFVIIGGNEQDIASYKDKCRQLNIQQKVHLIGPKPVSDLSAYLAQADILISPRSKGKNTPMKIYSYLDSGKPLVATNIYSHTQALNEQNAMLVEPNAESMAEGLLQLCHSADLRNQIGTVGKQLVEKKYSFPVFEKTLNDFYDTIAKIK